MEASTMFDLHMVRAYVDPVTVLPVTSMIATVVGVTMLCGKSDVESDPSQSRNLAELPRSRPSLERLRASLARLVQDDRANTDATP